MSAEKPDAKKAEIAQTQPAGNCVDKDFVSEEVVKEKVKAYEKILKANDLKVIKGFSDETPVLSIDRQLPESESSRLRKELDKEFQLWKQLYRESLNGNNFDRAKFFMQMKSLEKDFLDNKYEPYLNFVQVQKQQKALNTAFIETREKKKKKKKNFLRKRH